MSARLLVRSAVVVCLLGSLVVGCATDARPHVYIGASKDTVAVGETLRLTVTEREGPPEGGCALVAGPAGARSRSVSPGDMSWTVTPDGARAPAGVFVATKPGTYEVSCVPAQGGADPDTVYLPITITVVEAIVHKDSVAEKTPEVDPEAAVSIWDNHSPDAVDNGGTSPTFELDKTVVVTYLETYHYNGGQGTGQTGQISLEAADGTVYGPWDTEGVAGQGDVLNAYWVAKPNVELPAGSYSVIDSDPSTWSQNGGSNGAGMVRMSGVYVE